MNYIPAVGDVFYFSHHAPETRTFFLALKSTGGRCTAYARLTAGDHTPKGKQYGSEANERDMAINDLIEGQTRSCVFVRCASVGERKEYNLFQDAPRVAPPYNPTIAGLDSAQAMLADCLKIVDDALAMLRAQPPAPACDLGALLRCERDHLKHGRYILATETREAIKAELNRLEASVPTPPGR